MCPNANITYGDINSLAKRIFLDRCRQTILINYQLRLIRSLLEQGHVPNILSCNFCMKKINKMPHNKEDKCKEAI